MGHLSTGFSNQTHFAFLSNQHVLVKHVQQVGVAVPEFALVAINFKSVPSTKTQLKDVPTVCKFSYPPLHPSVHEVDLCIRSDPSPSWKPRSGLRVPFHKAQNERMFVVTIWTNFQDCSNLSHFIPFSALLPHVEQCESGSLTMGRNILWDEWGPAATRILPSSLRRWSPWVCYVYGTSYINLEAERTSDPRMSIYDFNQRSLRVAHSEDRDPGRRVITRPTNFGSNELFEGAVPTSLPFSLTRLTPPPFPEGQITGAMISEDSIVFVHSEVSHTRFSYNGT